jgi:DNA repair protein RadC
MNSNTAVRSEDTPTYINRSELDDDAIISKALHILQQRVSTLPLFDSPDTVKNYLILKDASRQDQSREVFSVLYLNSQHRLIADTDEFVGTLGQTSVYPREIVRAALRHNAAAVVLTHNHPSGNIEPSRADESLTRTLKTALATVDIRVLDHIVVAGGKALSMAERGLV